MGNAPRLRDDDDVERTSDSDRKRSRHERYDDGVYYQPKKDINEKENEVTDAALMKKRWQNRRRMAWASLLSMFLMTYLVFFTELVSVDRLNVLKEPLTWYYFACISVVGAYMGFTTWASKR